MYQFGIIHHSKYNYIVISIFKGKIKDDQITKTNLVSYQNIHLWIEPVS